MDKNESTSKPRVLGIDLETYSDVDLTTCGVYRYVEGDFHILLFAYAFDDEEVEIVDMAQGEKLPQKVIDAIFDDEIIKAAWNAQFERTCLSKYFGVQLSPNAWHCSMVHAASLSFPLSLKVAAEVLKTGEQKDKAGENLIRYFSIPCKPTKTNGGRTRNLPEHDPDGWEEFKSYCKQDVKTERDIRLKLERFPLLDHEWDYYAMDQRINDRGVMIDKVLVQQAITCDLALSDEMTNKAYELTGLENPNSVSQLKGWLEERGIEVDSLGKKNVAALIKDLDKHSLDDEALEMMKLRLQMAKSSVKKYQAADRYICKDGRAHGLFQFSGAQRTQRWSGRGIQLQNLPQNHIDTLDEARELIKLGAFDMVEAIYGNTPDILSQLIRTMLIPKPGHIFIVADFSAIEARVLAWLADEEWRMESFKRGDDIYCASASQMFGVPVVKHGINGELRQKGKVAELACIAEGSLVLTNHGLIQIEKVTTDDMVWDGLEWVHHDGVIYKGEKQVIEYEGLTATEDHLVFVEGKQRPVRFGIAAACGAHLIQTGDGGRAVRVGENHQSGETMEQTYEPLLCTDTVSELWGSSVAVEEQFDIRKIKRMPKLLTEKNNTALAGSETDGCKTTLRKSKRRRLSQLWGKRDKVRLSECDGSRTLFDSGVRFTEQIYGDRSHRHEQGLCSGQPEICGSSDKLYQSKTKRSFMLRSGLLALRKKCRNQKTISGNEPGSDFTGCVGCCAVPEKELAGNPKSVRVYDIRNAGRRHRFTVSNCLVHNCGYGGSSGALIAMGALDMGLKENELPDIISAWREANPKIVQFWWDVEKAARETMKDYEERFVGHVGFQFYSGTLWIVLPSGRKLAYLKPRLQPNRFGRMSITYEGLGVNNKWCRMETYSGKLTENICQATARDILAEAMWRMEKAGLEIVGHVHDEVIVEVPENSITVKEVCAIMNENPPWTKGLILNSDGYPGFKYYFKD